MFHLLNCHTPIKDSGCIMQMRGDGWVATMEMQQCGVHAASDTGTQREAGDRLGEHWPGSTDSAGWTDARKARVEGVEGGGGCCSGHLWSPLLDTYPDSLFSHPAPVNQMINRSGIHN